jgi:hypothetical protein
MGRRKKQTDIEDAINDAPRKNSELTEDERRALHFRHCSEYERALDIKKKAVSRTSASASRRKTIPPPLFLQRARDI